MKPVAMGNLPRRIMLRKAQPWIDRFLCRYTRSTTLHNINNDGWYRVGIS